MAVLFNKHNPISLPSITLIILVILSFVAILTRRLHDINISGKWILFCVLITPVVLLLTYFLSIPDSTKLIPLAAIAILTVPAAFIKGNPEPNKYDNEFTEQKKKLLDEI